MVSELFSNFHSRYVKADSPFTDTVHPASPHIYSRTPHHLTTNSLTMPVTPALAFAMGQGGTYIHFSQVLVLRCSSKPDCLGHSDPDRIQQHPTDLLPPPDPGNFVSCLTLPREQTLQIFTTEKYQKSANAVNSEAEVAVRRSRLVGNLIQG